MLPCRIIVVCLFCCCIRRGDARHQAQPLFPAASRMKRGGSTMNLIFNNSFRDVHLLFEIMLSGAYFQDSGVFFVEDAELASLRRARDLKFICEKIIPWKPAEILRLIYNLSNQMGPLHQDDFERTLLTLVYTAQQVINSTSEHQRYMWKGSFVSLYKAIKQDLTGIN
ncbi:hypothetical protein fugu_012027 [Takifugu bimaculatus]|uniref:Uncharacterized protein n=1 Tax=Takifugu bimaculatus TaxID=433685 RepID=A0A4Z2C9G5_9TELE|nr:hypothetical protein fugu_012027 [Takifugu bimaculatus]